MPKVHGHYIVGFHNTLSLMQSKKFRIDKQLA